MSELNPAIDILHEAYDIPGLDTQRRISVLLPHDYDSSNEHYPVLYLQDGQNLFNPHAPYGNWEIDHALGRLAQKGRHGIIIVAVDHGEDKRLEEYMPFKGHHRFGDGKGTKYVEFLTDKLIPHINEKYRTISDPKHTAIGGSSMGGLISLFASFVRPDVFGKSMIFSPSLWISQRIYILAKQYQAIDNSIYVYAGGRESWSHLRNVKAMVEILDGKPNLDLEFSVRLWARHSEHYWRKEFPKAINWLFFDSEL